MSITLLILLVFPGLISINPIVDNLLLNCDIYCGATSCTILAKNVTLGLISSAAFENQYVADNSTLESLSKNQSVAENVRQITVRILTKEGGGSGVIIARHGKTYTVLTNEHVVVNDSSNDYSVLTADGRINVGRWQRSVRSGNLDLALVQFDSSKSYKVAILGDSKALFLGDRLYAAGFPNYHFPDTANYMESTHNWGLKAFLLTTGEVSMLPEKSLPRGYSLGYTNEVRDGMSGGPVLNDRGQLVGINGRLKYPLQGIDAYIFTDGSRPSPELFEQMEALSWAIPIASFKQMISSR